MRYHRGQSVVLVRRNSKYPEWFLWFMEYGVRLLILAALAGLAVVYVRNRARTEERLGAIEKKVQPQVPRSFTPPVLADYAAGDVAIASLPVKRRVYVPIYSHIYYDGGRPYLLEATLSVRNADEREPLFLTAVHYYDTEGRLSRKLVDELIRLEPLQTIEFLVERRDHTGGSGANFIVDWRAEGPRVEAPYIEAIMVGRSGTNAISFVSLGRTLGAGDH